MLRFIAPLLATPPRTSTERHRRTQSDVNKEIYVVSFSSDGKYLFSGEVGGVGWWRVESDDCAKMTTIKTKSAVICLAVSADGKWVAGGTEGGDVHVWDVQTRKEAFSHDGDDRSSVFGVDFSPHSNQLLVASGDGTATIWNITTHQQVSQLRHDGRVRAAKYSPQGHRIVSATDDRVRVYDNNKHYVLLDIDVVVIASVNTGFLWFNNHLFVISDGKIQQFDASTGLAVSEWPAPGSDFFSCIALPKHGKFIVYSTKRTVTFWDTSTKTQLDLIEYPQDIRSIALSPDDQTLAIAGKEGMIRFERLSRITASIQVQSTEQDSKSQGHQRHRNSSDFTRVEAAYTSRRRDLNHSQPSAKKRALRGETAARAQQHDILIEQARSSIASGSWKRALEHANEVIRLYPSSPWGYEMKHAALHKAGEHANAVDAFEAMLLKMAQSPAPDVQRRADQYINPSSTRAAIRKIVQRTIRHYPRVLINTATGRLHEKAQRVSTFESLPVFNELVSSMTTRIDYARIKREVRQYFQYVMLSHKWEDNEPLFHQVMHIAVYDLHTSPTHDKLKMFCKIVRDAGFHWAWSDTCCINKSDHFVLQEALVAMFKWYQGSVMTIVFLRGVRSTSQPGALVKSIWNTRAWTLQEYIAARVIHFYTEDWTLYLNLKLPNHKESNEVILEMERATGVSARQLMALRPGLTCIREKLRLASTRQTTLVEDAAYSLLGIFSVTGVPVIYGEGEAPLGRLLAHVLAGSGDSSILAWTGKPSSFNSCLPAYINVFNGPAISHLPPPIPDAKMAKVIAASRSSFDLGVALELYDRLNELPPPWFAASRMKLPCIAFQLPQLSRSGRVYRADTLAFGTVEIATKHDLSQMRSLYLVHPWLDALMEQEDMHDDVSSYLPNMDDPEISDEEFDDNDPSPLPEPELPPRAAPKHMAPMDRETRARRLVARLRQPFGALLLTPVVSGRRETAYRRVAADSLITVQFREIFPLADILNNVRTLDVL